MSQDKIVIINGRKYDAKTGLPLPEVSKPAGATSHSTKLHASMQRSKTLLRRVVKRPPVSERKTTPGRAGRVMDIAKSPKVSRFGKSNAQKALPDKKEVEDMSAQKHPIVERAVSGIASAVKTTQKTAKQIKNDAISSALAQNSIEAVKKSFFARHPKSITIILVSIVIALLGGYFTYTSMPGLSVRFASFQAGIDASYPEYRPDGYSLDGPITYGEGEVTIKFKANTGSTKFTIKQQRSSWDSTAVLDNIVKKQVGENYLTSTQNGLTIYSYDSNGAWVNDSILYTIEGDAPLSTEQIRHIAISM